MSTHLPNSSFLFNCSRLIWLTYIVFFCLKVWDVSCGKGGGLIGGATIHLFNMKKQLKTGKHKLRLWPGKEADGSINTTTPGKVSFDL